MSLELRLPGLVQHDTGQPLSFSRDDHGTTLRINLRDAVPAGGATEVAIFFSGNVPEIDPEETGITTHVMKQVSAALRGDREMRRARDINFRCRGVMMLGTFIRYLPYMMATNGNARLSRALVT